MYKFYLGGSRRLGRNLACPAFAITIKFPRLHVAVTGKLYFELSRLSKRQHGAERNPAALRLAEFLLQVNHLNATQQSSSFPTDIELLVMSLTTWQISFVLMYRHRRRRWMMRSENRKRVIGTLTWTPTVVQGQTRHKLLAHLAQGWSASFRRANVHLPWMNTSPVCLA